jgi:hypothetical protein
LQSSGIPKPKQRADESIAMFPPESDVFVANALKKTVPYFISTK